MRLPLVGTKYQPHGLREEKAPSPLLSHMHTEHRPHAAPKGQEETLIRVGRIHWNKKSYSERGSREARAGGRAPAGNLIGLTSPPLAQALHLQTRRNSGPSRLWGA